MDTSASLTAVEYGTTIYKITDCDLEIEEEEGNGIIQTVSSLYDEVYDTYDLTVNFAVQEPGKRGESNRVFLFLTDEEGNTQYFMAFGGDDWTPKKGTNELTAKIPVSFLEGDIKYSVNVLTQVDGVNWYVCKEDVDFRIEE
ncbi:MAG: hypothetical protein HFH24_04935 [Ruminococcus sp.]|nr:hypothetical protein [Ruminococcus sp.]